MVRILIPFTLIVVWSRYAVFLFMLIGVQALTYN